MADGITLTIACDDYEIVQPLFDGRVKQEGLQLVLQPTASIAERQLRMLHEAAFDICELSATTYLLARERGFPLHALPIFLLRRFRHGDIFINTERSVMAPADLAGKRIGGIAYQVASNVWARGILAEYYDVPHHSITWVVERAEEIPFDVPANLRMETLPKGRGLEAALLSGDVDALMSPVVPPSLLSGDRRIIRLFPDYRSVEAAYFKKTGIFPIMHVLALKPEVVNKHPSAPARILAAFEEAKRIGYRRIGGGRATPLAWFGAAWEDERRTLGPDPWVYGLGERNIANVETIIRYMREQGMLRSDMSVRELFLDPSA